MNNIITRAILISCHHHVTPNSIARYTSLCSSHGRSKQRLDDEDYQCTLSRGFSTWGKRTGRRSFEHYYGRGNGNFFWSFIDDEVLKPRKISFSDHYQNGGKRNSFKEDSDKHNNSSKEDSDRTEPDLTSDRLALGLTGSGPLSIEDVKNAYRACAMKWHPDHHDESSKAIAEEKFKTLNAAYQSLCVKMEFNHEVSQEH